MMIGDGSFGKWITDDNGLPAYEYTCDQYTDPNALTATTYGSSVDHFHQIGNDRIAATAHNGGYIQILESSRGFQWLTFHDSKKFKIGSGITIIELDKSGIYFSDLYTSEVKKIGLKFKRIFGMGYFRKEISSQGISLINTICAPFSDDPVFISEIELKNNTDKERSLKIINFNDICLRHLTKSLIVTANNRKKFGKTKILNTAGKLIKFLQKIVKMDTDGSRDKFDKKFQFIGHINTQLKAIIINPEYRKKPPVSREEAVKHNYYPDSLFFSVLNRESSRFFIEQSSCYNKKNLQVDWDSGLNPNKDNEDIAINNPCMGIGTEYTLEANECLKIKFIFGYCPRDRISQLIEKYRTITNQKSILEYNAKHWKTAFIELNIPEEPWLSRESKWHSYYARSAAFFDEYYNTHKFPQGSIYQFGHGFDGAIRDFALFLPSIIFLNPQLAREYLISIIKLMSPDGKLPYGIHGFGKTLSAAVHSKPSDLYLFFLWAIAEYVFTTRDFNFLHETIDFYPKSLGKTSTVLERIFIAIEYFFSDKVGFGEHDLIKSNDGDWSDGISLMVKNRKKFIKKGESMFNSAFALYIIPKLIPLLEQYNPNLATLCKEKIKILGVSVFNSFNGKWFYRGWDGQDSPIGDKNIYLEHHTWLLICHSIALSQKGMAESLIDLIYENLDKPSLIGQYISFPPQETPLNLLPKGWDVNGGVWHAMNALLTWGYSKYDPEKSFNSLKKNSMAKRAEVYPNIWYGIWSGPDAYIADYAENAGEAFYHLPTPMCDFPLMNLNIHACYLLSIIKMIGIEVDYHDWKISPNLYYTDFQFLSPILSIISDKSSLKIIIRTIDTHNLHLTIRKPSNISRHCIVYINDKEIIDEIADISITKEHIFLKIKENYNKLEVFIK